MIEIIATAAVSGLLTGTAIGFSLARPWQDWTIKRINKDRADLRDSNDNLRRSHKKLFNEVYAIAEEREKLRRQLASAGKPDTQAVSDYMREIGARGNASPKRMSSKALATAGAAIEKRAKKASAEQREAA